MSFWTDNDLSLVYRRFVQKAEYEKAVYILGVAVDFGACHRRKFTKIGLIRVKVRNKCYHHHYHKLLLLILLLLLLLLRNAHLKIMP